MQMESSFQFSHQQGLFEAQQQQPFFFLPSGLPQFFNNGSTSSMYESGYLPPPPFFPQRFFETQFENEQFFSPPITPPFTPYSTSTDSVFSHAPLDPNGSRFIFPPVVSPPSSPPYADELVIYESGDFRRDPYYSLMNSPQRPLLPTPLTITLSNEFGSMSGSFILRSFQPTGPDGEVQETYPFNPQIFSQLYPMFFPQPLFPFQNFYTPPPQPPVPFNFHEPQPSHLTPIQNLIQSESKTSRAQKFKNALLASLGPKPANGSTPNFQTLFSANQETQIIPLSANQGAQNFITPFSTNQRASNALSNMSTNQGPPFFPLSANPGALNSSNNLSTNQGAPIFPASLSTNQEASNVNASNNLLTNEEAPSDSLPLLTNESDSNARHKESHLCLVSDGLARHSLSTNQSAPNFVSTNESAPNLSLALSTNECASNLSLALSTNQNAPNVSANESAPNAALSSNEPTRKRKKYSGIGCGFCRMNGETREVWEGHVTKEGGVTLCPILRKYVCGLCGESGDGSHTLSYCPYNREKRMKFFKTGRNAAGLVGVYNKNYYRKCE